MGRSRKLFMWDKNKNITKSKYNKKKTIKIGGIKL